MGWTMKATREDQQSLIELLGIDRELGKLNYALSTLPVYGELEAAESALGAHKKQATVRASGTTAIEKMMAECGVKVEQLNASIERKQGQLDSGENMDSRQLLVLQGEIDGLKGTRDEVEMAELEAMQELETLEELIEADKNETERFTEVRDGLAARKAQEVADLEEQIAEVRSRRGALAATIAVDVVEAYDESRSMGGAGVVIMKTDGTIDGGMDLSVTEIEKVRALPEDEVYLTEDTGSLVVKA